MLPRQDAQKSHCHAGFERWPQCAGKPELWGGGLWSLILGLAWNQFSVDQNAVFLRRGDFVDTFLKGRGHQG